MRVCLNPRVVFKAELRAVPVLAQCRSARTSYDVKNVGGSRSFISLIFLFSIFSSLEISLISLL